MHRLPRRHPSLCAERPRGDTPLPIPRRRVQVRAAWVSPATSVDGTPLADLAGYRLYYGQNSGAIYRPSNSGQPNHLYPVRIGGGTNILLRGQCLGYLRQRERLLISEVSSTTLTEIPLPPVASFTGTPTTGSAPLNGASTDASTGQITAWTWSFGDNTSSAQSSPQHTYASVGTYTVSLTVSGPGGANTITRPGYITATMPPPPSTGLVAAYGFNEGAGSMVTDASGNGNHGTISGAQWSNSGQFGKALVYDGVNDWVTISDSRPSTSRPA